MRLIDADKLKIILTDEKYPCALQTALIGIIDAQQTVYDVDEVVGGLYSLKEYSNPYDSYYDNSLYRLTGFENDCINKAIDDAIEIVKAGGIDE